MKVENKDTQDVRKDKGKRNFQGKTKNLVNILNPQEYKL